MALIGAMNAYRKSWFGEVGANQFPQTWDQYRDVGKKLKAKGYPIGQSFGQSFGDPPTFAYPLLWSFGGAELDVEQLKAHAAAHLARFKCPREIVVVASLPHSASGKVVRARLRTAGA